MSVRKTVPPHRRGGAHGARQRGGTLRARGGEHRPWRHHAAATIVCAATLGACAAPERPSPDGRADPLGRTDRDAALAALVEDGTLAADPMAASRVGTYVVQPNDTLGDIARERLGRADAWRDIARLNGIGDPASLAAGRRLRLPATDGDGNDGNLTSADGPHAHGSPAPPRTLDLGDAIAAARRHDAVLDIAAENAGIVRAGVPLARSALLPQANLQASVGRFGAGSDRDLDYTESEAALLVSQTLFDRARGRELARARLEADAAELRLLDAHETLVVRTAGAYFAVLGARSELEFRRSDLRAIERQLAQARQRLSVGASPSTDRDEALARRDLAKVALVDAENASSDALEALEELTGLEPRTLALAAPAPDAALERPLPADADAWVALAERYNASLRVADTERDSAAVAVAAARAARLPTLALEGALTGLESDNDFAVRPDGGAGSVGLVARLPLSSGGAIGAGIDRASAAARLADAGHRNVLRGVVRGTRTAYRDVVASVRRVAALEQALVSSRQAARATRAGFEAGTRTSVEVLASERNTLRAEADLAGARYAYVVNRLELQRVSGTLAASDVERVDAALVVGRAGGEGARP